MDGDAAQSIGVALAAIVAVSLALTQALGPLLMYLTESIKATKKVPDGWSGVVTLVIGVILGMTLCALSELMADTSYSLWVMMIVGAFGGALMAVGAVQQHKAADDMGRSSAERRRTAGIRGGPNP